MGRERGNEKSGPARSRGSVYMGLAGTGWASGLCHTRQPPWSTLEITAFSCHLQDATQHRDWRKLHIQKHCGGRRCIHKHPSLWRGGAREYSQLGHAGCRFGELSACSPFSPRLPLISLTLSAHQINLVLLPEDHQHLTKNPFIVTQGCALTVAR